MLRFGCAAILIVIVAIPMIASKFLPWYGTLAVAAAEVLIMVMVGPKLIGWGVKRFAMGLFTTKSRVLRGATVVIHEVTPTHKPVRRAEEGGSPLLEGEVVDPDAEADEVDEDESPKPSHYVRVNFTITPKPGQSRMTHYEPGEIMLIPFDQKVSMDEDSSADDRSASADEVQIFNEADELIEVDKVVGQTRLNIVFACPPGLRGRAKFRYYFETFGDLVVP